MLDRVWRSRDRSRCSLAAGRQAQDCRASQGEGAGWTAAPCPEMAGLCLSMSYQGKTVDELSGRVRSQRTPWARLSLGCILREPGPLTNKNVT